MIGNNIKELKNMNSWKKVNQWSNTILYIASNGTISTNVEITTVKDKLGSLKLVECARLNNRLESYNMKEIKDKIFATLN